MTHHDTKCSQTDEYSDDHRKNTHHLKEAETMTDKMH